MSQKDRNDDGKHPPTSAASAFGGSGAGRATRTEGEDETLDMPEGLGWFSQGQVLGERYQILEMLGRGGMGEVWRAFDLKLRVEVALKALRPEFFKSERRLELLRQEVRAAREVVSPNVCRIFDLIEVEGRELVSMEYVDGATLLGVLQERGPLELKEAQDIASQFLAGLEAIHKAGLVHRDIKPENIMLTRAGRVVVMDFGLARQEAEGGGSVSGTPAYMSPEQAAGQTLDARADVYSAGVVLAEMVSPEGIKSYESRQSVWEGVRSEPAKLPESPWAPVIQRAVKKGREERFNTARTLTRALEDVTLRVEGAEDVHPYPGLASFTEEDVEYFFGREAEVEHMWRKLEGPPRMLGLVGPSGAGKTSFLRAGLAPSAPSGWKIIRCTPGQSPIASIRSALTVELATAPKALQVLMADPEMPDVVVEAVTEWRPAHDHVLLVVDQCEELFTLNEFEQQARFAALLGKLPLDADTHVMLSIRDDFTGACGLHEALRPIFHELTVLNPPTGAALRRALTQPALQCGYRFEDDELVDEMLAEVEGERGALPLLAFAAARLWEKRDRETGLLTRQAYQDIGGVGGALARHAEATIDQIGHERLPIVRELFRNLVTAEGTRAVREWDELLSVFERDEGRRAGINAAPTSGKRSRVTTVGEGFIPSREVAEDVLGQLIDARLLTSYEVREADEAPTRRVEIIHESLLGNWPRLVRWQTQDQEGAQLRDELRQAARAWDEHGRHNDRLWIGTAYREYEIWRERYPGGLSELEEQFGHAMTAHSKRRRRRRRIAVTAAFATLLAVLAVLFVSRQQAVAEARRAEAAKLLALASAEIERYPTAALAYTRAGLELADTPEARRLAVEILWRGPVARILPVQRIATEIGLSAKLGWSRLALSPNGRWLAVRSAGGHVLLFPSRGGAARHVLSGIEDSPHFVGFGPASDVLVTSGSGQTVRLLSLSGLEEVRRIELGGVRSWAGVNGGNLTTLTDTSGDDGPPLFRVWPLDGGGPIIERRRDWPGPASFDSSGQQIAYGRGSALHVRQLDGSAGSEERVIGRSGDRLRFIRFVNPSEVVSIDGSGEIRLWTLSEPSFRILEPSGDELPNLVVVEDRLGALATVGDDAAVRLWTLHDPPDLEPVRLMRRAVAQEFSAAFETGGPWLAVCNEFDVAFWSLAGPRMRTLRRRGDTTMALVTFSPDGRRLVSTFSESGIRLWPLPPGDGGSRVILAGERCGKPLFFPDGNRVLVGTMGGSVFVAPMDGGTPRRLETGLEGEVQGTLAVAIDDEGRFAAAAPFDMNPSIRDPENRVLRVWDLPTGQGRTYSLAHLTDETWWGFSALHFLPDGSLLAAGSGADRSVRLVLPSEKDGEVTAETLVAAQDTGLDISDDGRYALVWGATELRLFDLASGSSRRIETHGDKIWENSVALDPTGEIIVTGDTEGVVRVGPATGHEPHLLLGGHEGLVWSVDISPDGKWIASVGGESIRLWPMPDVTKPPLHTLPHAELLAKLDSFTNLRAVRDETSSTGWTLEVGPFPGWDDVPEW